MPKEKLMTEAEIFAEMDALKAKLEAATKQNETYKGRLSQAEQAARAAGFNSFAEMQEAAAAAKKSASNGNGDFRSKIAEHHKKFFGNDRDEKGQPVKIDERMFDFFAAMIQDATAPLGKLSEYEKRLNDIDAGVYDRFSERDFLEGIENPEERKLAKQFLKDIRKEYEENKLYNPPEGADETYNGHARAWKNRQDALKKAGVKMELGEQKREPDSTPVRRIAFPGSGEAAANQDNKPGPGFDEKRFLAENPNIQNEKGEFDWETAFGLSKEEE
jgi:hypothetical protein